MKDPGAKDPKKQGGGQKIAGKEGKAGLNGKEDHTELPGEIKPVTNYGGLSEALADTGTDIKKTLSEIQTVADALGGLNSNNVVLGSGPGHGAEGRGRAAAAAPGAGVMFGSGTMNTGLGPGQRRRLRQRRGRTRRRGHGRLRQRRHRRRHGRGQRDRQRQRQRAGRARPAGRGRSGPRRTAA